MKLFHAIKLGATLRGKNRNLREKVFKIMRYVRLHANIYVKANYAEHNF